MGSRISRLVLSGLPMTPWSEMLDMQISPPLRTLFWNSFYRRDDRSLRSFGNLTSAYLDDVFRQPTLRHTLESLGELGSHAKFFVFQGTRDHNTESIPVKAFAEANQRRRLRGMPALDWNAKFYDSGHGLNGEAVQDIIQTLEM